MTKRFWALVREYTGIIVVLFAIRTFGFGLYAVPTGSMETTMLVGERFFADKLTVFFVTPKRGEIITFNDPLYPYSNNLLLNLFERYVWGPSNWTKRVIAVPGDTLRGAVEDGRPVVYVNGTKIEESYLNKYPLVPISRTTLRSYDPTKPYDDQPFYNMDQIAVKRAQRWMEFVIHSPTILYPGTPLMKGHGSDEFEVVLKENQYWVMGDNRLGSSDSRSWGILDGKLIHGKIVMCLFSVDTDESWWILDVIKHPFSFWKHVRWSRCFRFVR